MSVGIRTVQSSTNNGSSATVSVTTDASPQPGDLALAVHTNDFYAITSMPAPTGGPGGWTLDADSVADGGAISGHIKVWWAWVTSAGAMTVSVTETGSHDEEKSLTVWVLSGVDPTTPIEVSANAFGTSGTSQAAPAVSPSSPDCFLICVVNSGGGASTGSYTTPAPMTEHYELHVGGLSGVAAYQQLAAAGDTGARTFIAANSIPWVTSTLALKTAPSGTSRDLAGDVLAAADAAGTLSRDVPVAGVSSAAGHAGATVAVERGLVAAADAAGDAHAELATGRALAGLVAAGASASASLVRAVSLAGVVAAAAGAKASLTASAPAHNITVAATLASQHSAVASLAPQRWAALLEDQ